MWQDVKFALRTLRKNPAFTLVAMLALALGIGANSAIFSVVDALALRPLSFPQPEELVSVTSGRNGDGPASIPEFVHLRAQSKPLAKLGAWNNDTAIRTRRKKPLALQGITGSADPFAV